MAEFGKRLPKKEPEERVETEMKSSARKPTRLTWLQKWLLAVVILLAAALLATVAFKNLFVRPELPVKGNESEQDIPEQETVTDYGDGIQPKVSGERKSQDYYTVLILGRDTGGGGNTDTMLLASYDVTNQKAAVMSIPRDTMVNVSWDVKKINSVYNMYGGGEKGLQALYKEISQLVGFEPDYQVVVEWDAVGKIVDAIGGVDFDVPYPMDYHDPHQDLVIEQEAGLRHLTGDDAMQVIRWRKNDADSPYGYNTGGIGDSGRMELQQDFLKAVMKEMMQPKNVLNIGKIAKVFEESVETDLSFQNILWFGKQAFSGGLSLENVEFLTMPYKGVSAYSYAYSKQLGKDTYLSYVVPLPNKLLDIVNDQLSPFQEVFKLSDLDIMSVNADGSLSSTTGRVEDSRAAQPPQTIESTQETDQTVYLLDAFGNYLDPETGEVVYYTDAEGNVVHAGTGEIVDTPPESVPQTDGTDTPGTEPDNGKAESPGETPADGGGEVSSNDGTGTAQDPDTPEKTPENTGGEPADTSGQETPQEPEENTSGIIVVEPEEPKEPEDGQTMEVDPVTGEPYPAA